MDGVKEEAGKGELEAKLGNKERKKRSINGSDQPCVGLVCMPSRLQMSKPRKVPTDE